MIFVLLKEKGVLLANIQETKNSKGETVYKIRVSCGYTREGKQILRSKSWKPEKALSKKKLLEELNKQVVLFELELKNQTIQKTTITFEAVARDWLEYEKKSGSIKTSSFYTYKGLQERIFDAIGNIPIEKLTKAIVQRFVFDLSEGKDGGKPLATKTQKNYLSFVSGVCNYAIDVLEIIKSNPCNRVKCEKKESKKRQCYTIEEEVTLFEAFTKKNVPIKFQVFFMFLAYLGLRKGEALAIRWSDIDYSQKTVFIEKQVVYKSHETGTYLDTPKTKAGFRNLIIPQAILDMLPHLKAEQESSSSQLGDKWIESDYLFTSETGGVMSVSRSYSWLKKFCKEEGFEFKALHSFRHCTVTNLIHNNVDVGVVANILGHANPNITLGIYTHEIKKATAYGTSVMSALLSDDSSNVEPASRKSSDNDQTMT